MSLLFAFDPVVAIASLRLWWYIQKKTAKDFEHLDG